MGCARYGDPAAPIDPDQKGLGTVAGPGLAVAPATSEQCIAGGLIYTVFLDQNRNGTHEADETVTSTQTVCNGVNGANGADGTNGHSVVFQTVSAPADLCANGGTTIVMALDVNDTGEYHASLPQQRAMTLCNGLNGSDGTNGADGADGTDGTNGADAPVPMYAAVDSIQPCGNNGAYKEVLLRLQSGQVLASFSNDTGGTMTRLAFLPDGTFMTTDSTSCQFTLATSQDGTTRSISWFGQIQKLWNML